MCVCVYIYIYNIFLNFFIFFNVYLFLRQRETQHEQGRGRERGRHRIGSRLQAPSHQPRARRGARTHGPRDCDLNWSRTPNRLCHPGAPLFYIYWFLRDRERQRERGKGRERGRHRVRSRLQAPSCQHRARCGARTHGPRDHDLSWSRPLNWLSHPGALHLKSLRDKSLSKQIWVHLSTYL